MLGGSTTSSENNDEPSALLNFFKKRMAWFLTYCQAGGRHRKNLGKERKQAEAAFKEVVYRLSRNELISSKQIPFSLCNAEFLEYPKARQSENTHHNYSIALGYLEYILKECESEENLADIDLGTIDRFVSFRFCCASLRGSDKTVKRPTMNSEPEAVMCFPIMG